MKLYQGEERREKGRERGREGKREGGERGEKYLEFKAKVELWDPNI